MNKTSIFVFLTALYSINISTSSTSTQTEETRPKIIFIAQEKTIAAYVRATLQESFAVMDDQEEITHNQALYTATHDRDLIEQLIQNSRPTQRPNHPAGHNKKVVTPQPEWFTDDSGKQQYGIIVAQGKDCPLFLFEEEEYVYATQTLYTIEQQPPTAQQTTPNTSFVSNNRSFSSTSARHSSLPTKNQQPFNGKHISPLTPVTNDSFSSLLNLSFISGTNSDRRSRQTSTTSLLVHFSIHSK